MGIWQTSCFSYGKVSILVETAGKWNSRFAVSWNSTMRTLASFLGSRHNSRQELRRGYIGSVLGGGTPQQGALGKSACVACAAIIVLPLSYGDTWTIQNPKYVTRVHLQGFCTVRQTFIEQPLNVKAALDWSVRMQFFSPCWFCF